MLGPVSGTGRAMMASLQQAIQKGMPPDQAVQYVKSMATQGVAPLTDLYAMMNQFQRMKQQPVQAPQTPPTIRDQLNMAEQQQAQQQMAMQQQAQQQMAMQQGLGGMPAPAMEQAQFAGGGIVAFEEGGDVREFFIKQKAIDFAKRGMGEKAVELLRSEGIDPREVLGDRVDILAPALPRTPADQRTRDFNLPANFGLEGAGFGKSVVKPEPFGVTLPSSDAPPRDPRTDTTSRVGIGSRVPAAPTAAAPVEKEKSLEDFLTPFREAGKPLREANDAYRQFLDKDEASAKEQGGRDRMLALAQAGFGMAEAASKPGATFLGSAAAAGGNYAKNMMQLNREADAAKRGIVKERLALAQAEAAGNKADIVAASQDLNNYQTRLDRASEFKQELGLKHEELGLRRASLAIEQSLGFARLKAEIINNAVTTGIRKDLATAQAQDRLLELKKTIMEQAEKRVERLSSTAEFVEQPLEVRERLIQDEYNSVAAFLGGSMTGGGGASAGQWGQVSVSGG